jgi:catechol 2,3-dioxygenase-like lactoylglutathione lyase family enzyme
VDLNQVTVTSSDLARSEEFYARLGLRLIVRNDHYLRFECPGGESTFSVESGRNEPVGAGVTVYFETDELDSACERLVREGVVFDQLPSDMPWLWREARLRDPDGHELCLYHAGHNRRHPPWRLP